MRHISTRLFPVVLLLCTFFFLWSCSDDDSPIGPNAIWEEVDSPTTYRLDCVFGTPDGGLFAAGLNGTFLEKQNGSWEQVAFPVNEVIHGIWGTKKDNLWVVTSHVVYLYNGSMFDTMYNHTRLTGVCGIDESTVFFSLEYGGVIYYNGNTFELIPSSAGSYNYDIHSSVSRKHPLTKETQPVSITLGTYGNLSVYTAKRPLGHFRFNAPLYDVWFQNWFRSYISGYSGEIKKYDGGEMHIIGTRDQNPRGMRGIWGRSETEIFTVGDNGRIEFCDGKTVSRVESPTTETLMDIWGDPDGNYYAVGVNGTIIENTR